MTNKTVTTSVPDFVEQLKKYCLSNSDGCVFITSVADNRSGRVILDAGKITDVGYANYRGTVAIHAISGLDKIRYRFSDVQVNFAADSSLPSTDAILSKLLLTSDEPVARKVSTAGEGSVLNKQSIEDCLIDIIGPMGAILCEEHLHGESDTTVAISNIVAELSGEERTQFLKLVEERK